MKEYGRAKSGSTSKRAFYELINGVMNEFKGIYIHPDLVHFVEFSPKIINFISFKIIFIFYFVCKNTNVSRSKNVHEQI